MLQFAFANGPRPPSLKRVSLGKTLPLAGTDAPYEHGKAPLVKELDFGGVYVSPFVGDLVIAVLLYLLLRRLGRGLQIERRVWHPQLFNLCVFLIILSVIALFPL